MLKCKLCNRCVVNTFFYFNPVVTTNYINVTNQMLVLAYLHLRRMKLSSPAYCEHLLPYYWRDDVRKVALLLSPYPHLALSKHKLHLIHNSVLHYDLFPKKEFRCISLQYFPFAFPVFTSFQVNSKSCSIIQFFKNFISRS